MIAFENILVVDDDEMNLIQAKLLLEKHLNCNVILTSSVIDGMEILRQQKIDLVIASTDMSFVNGFRMIELMKDNTNLQETPIFLMTSSEYDAAMLEIEQSGANGGIKKPLVTEESIDNVKKFLKTQHLIPELERA